jgi:hypothetical protein
MKAKVHATQNADEITPKAANALAGCGKTTARPKMLSRFQVLWG